MKHSRYNVGCDYGKGKSMHAYALYDEQKKKFLFITTKKWQVKIGLFIAKILGWNILQEK